LGLIEKMASGEQKKTSTPITPDEVKVGGQASLEMGPLARFAAKLAKALLVIAVRAVQLRAHAD
jgi:hypothetical protein